MKITPKNVFHYLPKNMLTFIKKQQIYQKDQCIDICSLEMIQVHHLDYQVFKAETYFLHVLCERPCTFLDALILI